MNELFNMKKVVVTLGIVLPIMKSHTKKYWFMGSIVPTSLHKSLYREVHDIDIIVLTENLDGLLKSLYALGYKKKPLNFYRVSELLGVYVFSHPTLLDVGFFVIQEDASCYTITAGPVRVEIPFQNLVQREYTFADMTFTGIDPAFAYRLALLAKANPKRAKELVLYKSLGVTPATWPIYAIYIFGMRANWIMDMLNSTLVLIGNVRVKLGLPYDPWQ